MKSLIGTVLAPVLAGAAITTAAQAQQAGAPGPGYDSLGTAAGQAGFFERLQRDGG